MLPARNGEPPVSVWRAVVDGALVHFFDAQSAVDGPVRWGCFPEATLIGSGFHVPYRGGVFLPDALAQGLVEGGEVPVEVALHVVLGVARITARLEEQHIVGHHFAEEVRVGFDGSVGVWPALSLPLVFAGLPDDDGLTARNLAPDEPLGPPRRRRRLPVAPGSPEEAAGELVGPRSDVFVLAGLLWTVLGGSHPFTRETRRATIDALRRAELPPLSRPLPPPVQRLLRAALSLEPRARPADAAAFAAQLALFVDDDASQATAAFLRGLFPSAWQADRTFVEEAFVVAGDKANAPPVQRTLLVRNRDVAAFCQATGRATPAAADSVNNEDRPATLIDPDFAADIAAWLGGRIPGDREWSELARGGGLDVKSYAGVSDLCLCWEWTSTPWRRGRVVRGGAWRNRVERPLVDNRSWEDAASIDVGVRVIFD